MPQITIITPTYNSGKFIKRTIMSVLNQTFTDWEYLIVDDCSTDNTIEIITEYVKQDSRIRILKTPQNSGGPAIPKNIGIENAKGKYVAFLDHDDEWLPEKLNKQLNLFIKNNNDKLGLISCFKNIIKNDGKTILKHKKNYRGDVIKNLINNNFILTSSCVLTKLSILKEVGLFNKKLKSTDDIDMWLKISEAGYHFDFIPEILINYNIHRDNLGNKNKNQKEFEINYHDHEYYFNKYNQYGLGYYNFYKKNYKLSRKFFINNLFINESDFKQKIRSIIFIILSFFPNSEYFFRNIFNKINKI